MKSFSAQYIITNTGPALRRGIINTSDDGTIAGLEDTSGNLKERHSVEFHNGIIIPGFVNCHCHLELSHLRGLINKGGGLGNFIESIRSQRVKPEEQIIKALSRADEEMYNEGIALCADICNTEDTFSRKKESRIKYINLVEVFGIDPDKAGERIEAATAVLEKALETGISSFLVPHSFYSVSIPLLRMIRKRAGDNRVTSIHFLETAEEKEFLENKTGPLLDSYMRSGLLHGKLQIVSDTAKAIVEELTCSGNVILVHNTFARPETTKAADKRSLYWCLCPNSNLYIGNTFPPVELLRENRCRITIGTDSLASNSRLSILQELITIQMHIPSLSIPELVSWATVNGARALGEDGFGTLETGKRPGLLLLQNVDLLNMKLTEESFVTRLI